MASASVSVLALMASAAAAQTAKPGYLDFEGPPQLLNSNDNPIPSGPSSHFNLGGPSGVPQLLAPAATVGLSFEGISQYDTRSFGRGFIPPDTMGAVGATQFVESINGGFAVYDKATGARTLLESDLAFWAAAGQVGTDGDPRILFDKPSQKWIAVSFGASVSDIQIAVSTTSNALGPWQSTKFTGDPSFADFPTLAIDAKAIYIGTNNFASSFNGTTLNVIARSDLLGPGAPTTASLKQFNTPYPGTLQDRGFAIQGVNNGDGHVVAASLFFNDSLRYNINNPGTPGATEGPVSLLGLQDYAGSNGPARQPDVLDTGSKRTVDSGDQRIGSNAWEQNGKIYFVYTATPTGGVNADHTEVRWVVLNAATNAVIQQGTIAGGGYDYYYGSLAVNSHGQVVIGYDRSGLDPATGKISFMANTYNSLANGQLIQTDSFLLHVSSPDDYHNGSADESAPTGRQRWGDYSAVTVDPNNDQAFWAIGQFAREWNNPDEGHPTGSGGSRWGTWISEITLSAVPEPATWGLMLVGFGLVGGAMRRKAKTAIAA